LNIVEGLPPDEAEASLRWLTARRPSDLSLANALGWQLVLNGKLAEALAHFEPLEASTPHSDQNYPYFLCNLAEVRLLLGQTDSALKGLGQCVKYRSCSKLHSLTSRNSGSGSSRRQVSQQPSASSNL
jgi:ATP/maltotriose-dependent transcriptional regulator MalT